MLALCNARRAGKRRSSHEALALAMRISLVPVCVHHDMPGHVARERIAGEATAPRLGGKHSAALLVGLVAHEGAVAHAEVRAFRGVRSPFLAVMNNCSTKPSLPHTDMKTHMEREEEGAARSRASRAVTV